MTGSRSVLILVLFAVFFAAALGGCKGSAEPG